MEEGNDNDEGTIFFTDGNRHNHKSGLGASLMKDGEELGSKKGYCWIVSLGCCDVTEAGHADELEAERERSQLMSILAAD